MRDAVTGVALLVVSCGSGGGFPGEGPAPDLAQTCAEAQDALTSWRAYLRGAPTTAQGQPIADFEGAEWKAFRQDLRELAETAARSGDEELAEAAADARVGAAQYESGGSPKMLADNVNVVWNRCEIGD